MAQGDCDFIAQSVATMARVSKKAKRSLLAKRKSHLHQFVSLSHSSFTLKFSLISQSMKISKLIAEKYGRNPRRSSRVRSTEWCEKDMKEMSDTEFRKNFRLSRAAFGKLLQRVDPEVRKEETFAGNTVSVERRLALTLYFLGQGTNYRTLANQFGVGISTVCQIVKETARAIQNTLISELVKFPTSDAELLVAMKTFDFPKCVGAIDGTHIKIKKPKFGTDFYNRKGYYSILLQGVCDGNGKFTSISCGHPGSIHDARMLKRSGFYQNVLAKR